jgi:hypothetical protein
MNFKVFSLIYFSLSLLCPIAISELVYTMAAEETKTKNTIKDAFLMSCLDWACYRVREFQISNNNVLNCYQRNVAITFSIDFQNGSRSNTLGFLSTMHGNQIVKELNPSSAECQVVKR